MKRFKNRLDPPKRGTNETKARPAEIIQNAVWRQTGRKEMEQHFKDMGDGVRKLHNQSQRKRLNGAKATVEERIFHN